MGADANPNPSPNPNKLKAWRGIRDDALVKISDIQGSKFVHASGFIGGNATYEGALAMAKKTLSA